MRYKLLWVNLFPELGGAETSLVYLIKNLNKNKFKLIVILPRKGSFSKRLKRQTSSKLIYLNLPGYLSRQLFIPGANLPAIWQFYKLCQKIKPDLIHLNQPTLAIYGGIVGGLLKIPVLASAHGFWDSLYFYQDLANNIFLDKIIANSPKLKKTLLKRGIISPNKVLAIPFGIDTKMFSPGSKSGAREKLKLPKNKLIVTIVGRLDPQKDHLNFFEASKIITQNIANVSFFIVGSKLGDFSETNYQEKIAGYLKKNPKIAEKIIWGGFRGDMPLVYQASDILVMSSSFEGLPLTLLEAASSGLPIVATKSGSVDLVVKEGKNGFLVAPHNPKKLAEKVIILARDQNLREEFGKEGRKRIVKNYPIEKYVKVVENVYLSMIEKANHRE